MSVKNAGALFILSEMEKKNNILNKYIHQKNRVEPHQVWFVHVGDTLVPPSVRM